MYFRRNIVGRPFGQGSGGALSIQTPSLERGWGGGLDVGSLGACVKTQELEPVTQLSRVVFGISPKRYSLRQSTSLPLLGNRLETARAEMSILLADKPFCGWSLLVSEKEPNRLVQHGISVYSEQLFFTMARVAGREAHGTYKPARAVAIPSSRAEATNHSVPAATFRNHLSGVLPTSATPC